MTNRSDLEQEKHQVSAWVLFPFVEQLFVVALFGLLAPGVWAVHLMARGALLPGIVVLVAWAAAFGWSSMYLHRRRRARLWLALSSAALVLIASAIVFSLP